jgi:Fic family protein
VFRDNPKELITRVGDSDHGGVYKPPQYGGDIRDLMEGLISWHEKLLDNNLPALIRAPLVHLYYEWIHPFWDGNGRVGRVLEATLLQAAGYKYAPFALARYYLEHIDKYFTLFNVCRKQAERNESYPNTNFVVFHLEGMLAVINKLHDRVNHIVNLLLFESHIRRLLDTKKINVRQYTIVSQILDTGKPIPMEELRRKPWYESLYLKLSDKTRQRDLHKLLELKLVVVDERQQVWPGLVKPG